MIKSYENFEEFKKAVVKEGIDEDLEELVELDTAYFREYKRYAVLVVSAPSRKVIAILKDKISLVYSEPATRIRIDYRWLKEIKNRKNAENTLLIYSLLDNALDEYESKFQKLKTLYIRNKELEKLDRYGHEIRELIDDVEAILRVALRIQRTKSRLINIKAIEYDYDILFADARYLLERLIVLKKDIINTRQRYELEISKELNVNVAKLTEIMLILTIVSLVLSVPNTVATIFGVSTLAELVPAQEVIDLIVISTIIATILSIWYIKRESKYLIKT